MYGADMGDMEPYSPIRLSSGNQQQPSSRPPVAVLLALPAATPTPSTTVRFVSYCTTATVIPEQNRWGCEADDTACDQQPLLDHYFSPIHESRPSPVQPQASRPSPVQPQASRPSAVPLNRAIVSEYSPLPQRVDGVRHSPELTPVASSPSVSLRKVRA